MTFDVCRTFLVEKLGWKIDVNHKKLFKIYSFYSWGIPLLIVSMAHIADQLTILEDYMPAYAGHRSHPGNELCWINNQLGFGMFFALPVASLVLENFLLFIMTLICILYSNQ